jgi:hypothetical protein
MTTSSSSAKAFASAVFPFRSLGYHVFPRVVPMSCYNAMRKYVPKAAHSREAAFISIPSPSDVLTQEVREEDPTVTALRRKFAEHEEKRKRRRLLMKRRRLLEAKKRQLIDRKRAALGLPPVAAPETAAAAATSRKKDGKLDAAASDAADAKVAKAVVAEKKSSVKAVADPALASASDIAAMSQRIAEQLAAMHPGQSRIDNDPQRLQAINAHSCNLWMTEPALAELVHGNEFGKQVLGRIATELGGVRSPVLFCDRPVLQLPFGRPTIMHFARPFLGVDQVYGAHSATGTKHAPNAIAVWVPLSPSVSIRIMERSHLHVEERMRAEPRRLDPRLFRLDFRAVDSNTTLWARRFPDLLAEQGRAVELVDLPPGTAVAFDPFTFAAVAPNTTMDEQAVLQFLIVSSETRAACTPSVHPFSWIREWKASSLHVDFNNSVVFPRLF